MEEIRFLTKEEIEKQNKIGEENFQRIEKRAKEYPKVEKEMMKMKDKIDEELKRKYGKNK